MFISKQYLNETKDFITVNKTVHIKKNSCLGSWYFNCLIRKKRFYGNNVRTSDRFVERVD